MVSILLVSCGKKESGPGASKAPIVLDSAIYNVWEAYDPKTNIEEMLSISDYGHAFWFVRYRDGSVIQNKEYYINPLTKNSLEIAWILYPKDEAYQFTYSVTDSVLTLCQEDVCGDYTRR